MEWQQEADSRSWQREVQMERQREVRMEWQQEVTLRTLLQVTQALEAVVSPCFGPWGGQVLFTQDTGEVLITRDGQRILRSLRLAHPLARVLVECVLSHSERTGDGSKSFLLLLGEVLRGIHRDRLHGAQARRILLSLQTVILDAVICCLSLQALPLLVHSPAHLSALADTYFRGRVARSYCGVLSRTACQLWQRWGFGVDSAGAGLICRYFVCLHTAVPGLPVSRSQVLSGLVIHRDFTVHCPCEGPLRALATAVPLLGCLAPSDVTLRLESLEQVQGCWGEGSEGGVQSLLRIGVGLLLSEVKQPERALELVRRAGISVLECVDRGELELFCRLAGVELFTGDWSQAGEEHIATVTFCKPVVLGSDRLVHVGLQERCGLAPHCVVLCGPSRGLAEQCSTAFCGLFRMLRCMFEPVHTAHPQGPAQSESAHPWSPTQSESPFSQSPTQSESAHPQSPTQSESPPSWSPTQSESAHPQSPTQSESPFSQSPTQSESPPSPSPTQSEFAHPQCPVHSVLPHPQSPSQLESVLPPSSSQVKPPFESQVTELGGVIDAYGSVDSMDTERPQDRTEGPLYAAQSRNPLSTEPHKAPEYQVWDWVWNGDGPREWPGIQFVKGKEAPVVCITGGAAPSFSGVLIETGSVLPAGGAFEFLLHRTLLQRASHSSCPDERTACRLLAGAVLSVLRLLYPRCQSHFPQGCGTRTACGLESVACKYQLLQAVLHTAARLLSVDLILHTYTDASQEQGD